MLPDEQRLLAIPVLARGEPYVAPPPLSDDDLSSDDDAVDPEDDDAQDDDAQDDDAVSEVGSGAHDAWSSSGSGGGGSGDGGGGAIDGGEGGASDDAPDAGVWHEPDDAEGEFDCGQCDGCVRYCARCGAPCCDACDPTGCTA